MKLAALLVALVAPVAIAGCGDDTTKKPKPDPTAEARVVVETYLEALGSSDAAAACRVFSEPSQKQIAAFGREKLKTSPTCTATLEKLLTGQPGGNLKKLGAAPVTTVKVSGNAGEARVKGLEQTIHLVREGGAWRIRSQPTGKTDF